MICRRDNAANCGRRYTWMGRRRADTDSIWTRDRCSYSCQLERFGKELWCSTKTRGLSNRFQPLDANDATTTNHFYSLNVNQIHFMTYFQDIWEFSFDYAQFILHGH